LLSYSLTAGFTFSASVTSTAADVDEVGITDSNNDASPDFPIASGATIVEDSWNFGPPTVGDPIVLVAADLVVLIPTDPSKSIIDGSVVCTD
jgi:hypothetical protein